ncbi:MAG: nitroreductase [Gemmatimonadaceae bacterium]
MNSTIDLLLRRRSVSPRLLGEPAPSLRQVSTILTAASRVPDHGRAVPWRFIVIRKDGAARLGEVIVATYFADHPDAPEGVLETESRRLLRAPLVIAVVSSPHEHSKAPEWEQQLSAGAAAMNLVIAVNALGFASNWHTEWYAYDRRVTSELGLKGDERIAGFVHIGTAIEQPKERPRPELSDVVVTYGGTGIKSYNPELGDGNI